MKTLAVIVTHNRRDLLGRCIDHLQAQTCLPEAILVVNNASTDNTVEMLKLRGIPFVTQENVGSAGGWHRGIKHAMDRCFDVVWLMDDDGYPDPGALAALKAAMDSGVACASSVVVREDALARFVFPFPVLDAAGLPIIWGWPRKLPTLADLRSVATAGTYPFAHFFNGALISVAAVREVGNVNCDYFIYGDEVDYFFRLRKAGAVISVLDAVHYHPDVSKRAYSPLKAYYLIKNSLVLNKRYFNAVWIRHVMLLLVFLYRVAARNGFGFVIAFLLGKHASVFYSAIVRGLRGKIGKDFNG